MIDFLGQFAVEEAAEKTGLAVLGIDPKALLLQLITFLIIFFLIKFTKVSFFACACWVILAQVIVFVWLRYSSNFRWNTKWSGIL